MKNLALAFILIVASLGVFSGCDKEFGSTATANSPKSARSENKAVREHKVVSPVERKSWTEKSCPEGKFWHHEAKRCMDFTFMNWLGDGMGRAMDRRD